MNKAPAIIPPERIVESISETGLAGYFEVELIHKPTGLVKFKSRFKNLITNAALEDIGSGGREIQQFSANGYLAVGTGNSTPTVTQTTLDAEIARTQSRGSPSINGSAGQVNDYEYFWNRTTKVLLPGVGTGNLQELGLFRVSSGGTMFCRQLFRDNDGNPVVISKTADDELRVTYEFRLYTMKTTNTATLTVKGVERTFTTRGYDLDGANRWGTTNWGDSGLVNYLGSSWSGTTGNVVLFSSSAMPALNSTQVGTGQTGCSSGGWGSYTGGTRYRDYSATWNPGLGNLTIGSVVWGAGNAWNEPFITTIEPAISKTDTERFTFTGRMAWGRV